MKEAFMALSIYSRSNLTMPKYRRWETEIKVEQTNATHKWTELMQVN